MKAQAIAKEDELTVDRRENIRKSNAKVSEFNELPRSVFHEKAGIPRARERQQEGTIGD